MEHHKIQTFLKIDGAFPINKIQTVIGTSKCQENLFHFRGQ